MPAGIYDILAEQGATLRRVLTWRDANKDPIDLTGYSARMQVRKTLDTDSVLLSLSTANGSITLGGSTGTVTIEVSPLKMSQLAAGIFWYDIELVSPTGVVTRLLQGRFNVSREVTR